MTQVPLRVLSDQLRALVEEERNYSAAFDLGRHILRYWPKHVVTYARLASAALTAGLTADAVDLYQRCLSADPEDPDLWTGYARAAADLGLEAEAELAARYAADLTAANGTSLPAQAHAARRRGDWATARDVYGRAMAVMPGRMDLLLGLATVLWHQNEKPLCERMARQALTWLPHSLKAHALLLMLEAQYGQTSGRTSSYRLLFALDPDGEYLARHFRWPAPFAEVATLPAWTKDRSHPNA